MKALVLGARGAVGSAAATALRDHGHHVVGAGRRAPDPDGVALDVTTPDGLDRLAAEASRADVVVDASGLEVTSVQAAVGTTPLVDISATAAHLERVGAGVPTGGAALLGAGIAPGLSTVLVRALDAAPGDEVDVAVMLGSGEAHGPAAVEWTVRLAGTTVHAAPEPHPVPNLRSRRRLPAPATGSRPRTHLRTDFPDDLLLGRPSGITVRSWLVMDTRLATAALGLVGRFPALAAATLRNAPQVGGEAWSVSAIHRGTGRTLAAVGDGQSGATGRLAALAADRLVSSGRRGPVTMADVVRPDELESAGGIRLIGAGD